MNGNGAPGRRSCTADFKIHVIAKWQKQRGATKGNPATVGIGISIDEINRMRTESGIAWQVLDYPLIELRLTRQDCEWVIRQAGLPVPPKSSCYFCPFHTMPVWKAMQDNESELFRKSVELEALLNERLRSLSKDPVWFSRMLMPLDKAVEVWALEQRQKAVEKHGNLTLFDQEERHSCGPYVCTAG